MKHILAFQIIFFLINAISSLSYSKANSMKTILYIGSYTQKPPFSEGWLTGTASPHSIRSYQIDHNDGSLTLLKEYGADVVGKNCIYMATSKNNEYLYVVNSLVGDNEESDITAFKIDKNNNGALTKINTVIGTGGENAVHISLDDSENYLFVAHYSGNGALSVFKRNPIDGSIGSRVFLDKYQVQNNNEPHPHSAYSINNKYIYVPDLGRNLILNYEMNPSTGQIKQNPSQPNGITSAKGPRHMAFHSNGLFAYVVNELSSEVNIISIEPTTGKLNIVQDKISTLPPGVSSAGHSAGAIRISVDQKYLYVSNRGASNSISAYRILQNGSKLSYFGTYDTLGLVPRDFYVLNDYVIVLNQNSASIVTFKIEYDGSLTKSFGPMSSGLPLAVVAIQI
jgi:6-phosphogluconolactonase